LIRGFLEIGKSSALKRKKYFRKVMNQPKPARTRNRRTREYLTPEEIDRLLAAAKDGATRNPERDHCLLGMMFRHGLRVSEAIGLRLTDIDLEQITFYIHRLKESASGAHPIYQPDRKALVAWLRARKAMKTSKRFPVHK
jgi:integrase